MENTFLIITLSIVSYVVTFFFVIHFKKTKLLKHSNFPKLKLKKSGVFFYSFLTHRIKIQNAKTILIGNALYLKTNEKVVIFSNVKDVKIFENFLYFTGVGEVKILFDCETIYRYFSIKIKSKQFELETLKQLAILDLLNNDFEIKFSKLSRKYIKIIEKVLNICIFEEKIIVKPNKFKLSFVLIYKLNNRIKHINISETI